MMHGKSNIKFLRVYFSEISLIHFFKNAKSLALLCSTYGLFLILFFKFFQMLCLDENMELLKLRSLIDMNNLVPAREYVNRNDERVLILQNPEKQYISLITRILVVVFSPTVGQDSHYSDRFPCCFLLHQDKR
jgi:hypothetical protein